MSQGFMAKPFFVRCKVLVVDHDPTSLCNVSAMLQHWHYDVMTVKSSVEALATIRSQQDFDIVVSELHMPEMNGIQLQKQINEEFNNLPVIVMSYDDRQSEFYIVKPVKLDDLKNLWQFAVTSKRGKLVSQRKISRSRVTWTYELHNKFIEAISHIGLDNCVPSNILEFMNVPGLTREQVASHLQRYRNSEKGANCAVKNLRSTFASGSGHSSIMLQDEQMTENQWQTRTSSFLPEYESAMSSYWNTGYTSGLENMESINTLGLNTGYTSGLENGSYGLINGTAGAFGHLSPGDSSSSARLIHHQQQGNQTNINPEQLNGPYPRENYPSGNQDSLEEFIKSLLLDYPE